MIKTSAQLLRSYLEDAIAAEKAFASRLREFSLEGDDDDVKAAFAAAAEQAAVHSGQLTERLQSAGAAPSTAKTIVANLFGSMLRPAHTAHVQEEGTVQNLVMAYTFAASACAMYESLGAVAHASGDSETSSRAREIQTYASTLAEKLFHFIPTRSIIAYNMLTLDEVDPAVQTKVGEASWT
jgi:ferritin-like metal-binding protein YciE